MNKAGQLSYAEYLAITEHVQFLQQSISDILEQFMTHPDRNKSKYIKGQIAYYKNGIAILKWTLHVASQRLDRSNDDGSSPLHQFGTDNSERGNAETGTLFD